MSDDTQRLPDFNRVVVARMRGYRTHGDSFWGRLGVAFMVRHDDEANTVAEGWSRSHYDKALEKIDADCAVVEAWAYVEEIKMIETGTLL